MQREDIENLRARVSCAVGLEQAGFALDLKESTRRAVKYRRGAEIIIVTHQGKGWFDPLSDRKGDVFALLGWLHPGDFPSTLAAVAALAGIAPAQTALWSSPLARQPRADIASRWAARPLLREGSPAHAYLSGARAIPAPVLDLAVAARLIRQGPAGSAWFAHHSDDGAICGWEERGPSWRGYSSGGAKVLFRFGNATGPRLCISEAAIDALSLSALEGHRRDTLYASTAGGWSPATERAVVALTKRLDLLVAATDRNSQGEAYADTLRRIAVDADCGFQRRCPVGDDWNDDLTQRREG
ncbi:hypothetical protein ASG39_20335 [Rhizobium sp. Leaf371]|uniref:DUF3991 and TOPRIM domain-containing protein n=1 Tax=Rhizobium sp. Leaf371 TaxID=1736355 RepID=UPI000712464E|nr:DUF3991 and TOPRIM domain-containing protein [Rhizobium sp. Leaf371]KQS71618.1 hypothetical protein ASG39_20335 [Rhizobium sp. Leaf371]